MAYQTLDHLPDLGARIINARPLEFKPYTVAGLTWDALAESYGLESGAILRSVFTFKATAGATYDFFSTSFFDPFILLVYDSSGNVIAANDDADDGSGAQLTDGVYLQDVIWDWTAPYTGDYYVDASWNQGSYFTWHSLSIYEDTGTTANIYASTGSDQLWGGVNADTILAGEGNDTVIALDGNDLVRGGAGNDDVNGNVGNDIVMGDDPQLSAADGADFVRGGRGDDVVAGGGGDDPHVNGNIGNDQVYGGAGNDTVYGGQDADTLYGDAGADLLSGDLGNDALFGGAGADRFTISPGGGMDWVADFKVSDGDRVQLAPGTAYSIISYQGQVMIDLGGGTQIGLAGVPSVSGDWLVFA